jgi:hypothetical protein
MPFNPAGLNNPHAVNQLSLHSSNPGIGASPAAGTELTDAPYERQVITASGPVAGVLTISETAVFDIATTSNQNVQFIGLWEGATYKGYAVPGTPRNFTEVATIRQYTILAGSTISIVNPS